MRVQGRVLQGLVLGFAALGLLVLPAAAAARLPEASLSPLGPETSVPFGWVDFCQRYKGE